MSQALRTFMLGLGANLSFGTFGPQQTLVAAVAKLKAEGLSITAQSGFYETEPQPKSDQPNFINCVIVGQTAIEPRDLLALCQLVETEFGRERSARWSARTLDIDILDFDGQITPNEAAWNKLAMSDGATTAMPELALPHPRLHQRAFVLVPLHELAAGWQHPVYQHTVSDMLKGISPPERDTVRQFGGK